MRVALPILLAVLVGCAADPTPSEPPNLVLIIGDDHGFGDFGFTGSQVALTPRLDELAATGTVFTHGYTTSSMCQPSLRTLLTGLQPAQFGGRARDQRPADNRDLAIRSLTTLPQLLAERGYASFQSGKYWEGTYRDGGFDEGMNDVPGQDGRRKGDRILRDGMEPVFDFIDRNLERPFFLWFAPKLPHIPHNAPADFLRLYSKSDHPLDVRTYYASISWFDAGVGELLDHLERRGVRDRTVVVYLVDNGWQEVPLGEGAATDRNVAWLGGPRGKQSLYDPGFRTPIVFHWPGFIPGGRVIPNLTSIADVFPTLLGFAGVAPPEGRTGRDLRPILDGVEAPVNAEIIGYQSIIRSDTPAGVRVAPGNTTPGGFFLRTARWHYLWYALRSAELYDLEDDPGEARDVAADHLELTRGFENRIRAWAKRMDPELRFLGGVPMPGTSPAG